MPYMGSKRKIANPIMNFILEQNPKTKYFYDLFGGGGAMSFEAIQRPQIKKVFYNELNTGVVELLKKIKNEGVSKELYQWITRKVFNENKNKDDWFGGLCKVVWSFGNNQSDYLFGKDIEEPKRLMHEIIVNHDKKAQEEFQRMFDIKLETEISSIFPENLNQRRLRIMVQVKKLGFERNLIELQRL